MIRADVEGCGCAVFASLVDVDARAGARLGRIMFSAVSPTVWLLFFFFAILWISLRKRNKAIEMQFSSVHQAF
jgi:hypothetical protein